MILQRTRLNNKILDSNASQESSSLKNETSNIFQDLIKNKQGSDVIVYSRSSPLRHFIQGTPP